MSRLVIFLLALVAGPRAAADEVIRIMAANTSSGNFQSYDLGHGNRIFQGLEPDIALVQEMNVGVSPNKNTPATYRAWVDANFGSSFSYRVETGKSIPNGIVSRFPILDWGVWDDDDLADREFVWAKIDIPGDTDLWAISVHLKASSGSTNSTRRNNQAVQLLEYINSVVPASDYLVLGGDFNTDSRTEACINTLSATFATGSPWPVDQAGNGNTNSGRDDPYDWVMPDADLNARKTPLVIGSLSFPNGLVFDSRVFTPLSAVAPILATDSGASGMQHMAVMRAFLIPTNAAPVIAGGPTSSPAETAAGPGGSVFEILRGASTGLSVTASDDGGASNLTYTWRLAGGPGSFSANGTNSAKSTTVTFQAPGDYNLAVDVRDAGGLVTTGNVNLRVLQKASAVLVTPNPTSVAVGNSRQFSAVLRDQFGQPMVNQPSSFIWSTTGGGTITGGGNFTATTAGGPFTVTASSASVAGNASISVSPGSATITLTNLTTTYDGDPKNPAVITDPPGLAVTLLYENSAAAPVDAGSYQVSATIADANYQGSASGELIIEKAPAAISFGDLTATYDGQPKIPTATTIPPGLTVTRLYDGSSAAPVNAGFYQVSATISDTNYQGSASAGMTIGKATAAISFAGLTLTYDGQPKPVIVTTAPAGLTVVTLYEGSPSAPVEAGSYPVTANIDDANFTGISSAELNILPDAWASWKNEHFTAAEQEQGLAADLEDPDADGLANLVEFALGENPRAFTKPPAAAMDGAGFSITFTRPANLPGIRYLAESAGAGLEWSPVPLEKAGEGQVETMRASIPAGGGPSFLRLRIERE